MEGRKLDGRWIAVLGSGQVEPGHPVYQLAEACGRVLAEAGWGVVTGGYLGVMEAASRAARAAGGQVASVPCREFRRARIHPYAATVLWTDRYEDRIRTLCEVAQGYWVLPGGIGTMAELFYTWSMAQLRYPRHKPVILVGPQWPVILEGWRQHLMIPEEDWRCVQWASDPTEALTLLERHLRDASASRSDNADILT
jgi:uncharacterized protein (TIGR00730 family)